jgi:hypothetical protein
MKVLNQIMIPGHTKLNVVVILDDQKTLGKTRGLSGSCG